MKGMGDMADVPIEPEEQSRLLDACCQLPGVIGAGVPGGESDSMIRLQVISDRFP
jgi:phosphomevalonate kinase